MTIKEKGFTLLELVIVITTIGVIAAVVAPRLLPDGHVQKRLEAEKVINLLRQSQLNGMSDPRASLANTDLQRCSKVSVSADAISIAKRCQGGVLTDVELAAQRSKGHFAGTVGLALTSSLPLPYVIQFGQASASDPNLLSKDSKMGRPFINNQPLSSRLTITVAGREVYIEPEGYIHGSN